MAKTENSNVPVQVKARVLVDCAFGKCNEVVLVDADQIGDASVGVLDAAPAAVAYAESLVAPE